MYWRGEREKKGRGRKQDNICHDVRLLFFPIVWKLLVHLNEDILISMEDERATILERERREKRERER